MVPGRILAQPDAGVARHQGDPSVGKVSAEEREFLEASKSVILHGAKASSTEIRRIIGIYDSAYAGLIERHDPRLFQDFLLGAPKLFLDIGDRMGAIFHITSFWNYRFPVGAPRAADAAELAPSSRTSPRA